MRQVGDFIGGDLDDENWRANLDSFLDIANENGKRTGLCDVFPWVNQQATTTNDEEKKRQRLSDWHRNEQFRHNEGKVPEHRVKILDGIQFFERFNRIQDFEKRKMDDWSTNYQDVRSIVNELKCKAARLGKSDVEHKLHNRVVKMKDWPLKHCHNYPVGSRPRKLAVWCTSQFKRQKRGGSSTKCTFENGKLRPQFQCQVDLLREIGMPGSDELG